MDRLYRVVFRFVLLLVAFHVVLALLQPILPWLVVLAGLGDHLFATAARAPLMRTASARLDSSTFVDIYWSTRQRSRPSHFLPSGRTIALTTPQGGDTSNQGRSQAMSNHVRISAKYRKEPDYGKLARALLLFLEQQAEVEGEVATRPDMESFEAETTRKRTSLPEAAS